MQQNENDSHPLHLATSHNAPLEVIDKILAAWPDAAKVKDKSRWYPLHWAALQREEQLVIIEKLLVLYPKAAAAKTITDRTPADIVELEDERPANEGKSTRLIELLRAWEADPEMMMAEVSGASVAG